MSDDREPLGDGATNGLLDEAVKSSQKLNPNEFRRDSLLKAIGQYNEGQRGKRRTASVKRRPQ